MSGYFPTITAGYGMNQTITNPGYQSNLNVDPMQQQTNQGTLSANLLIFDGLVREMNLLAAKHNAKQTEAQEVDARRLLIKSVINGYNTILLQQENIRIALSDMDFNDKLLKETELKFEAGAVPLSDVLNFKIKYNNAESGLINAQYNYATAKYALAILMGLTDATIPETVKFPSVSALSEETLMGIDVYLDMALSNRPDLKAYREALESAKYTMYSKWGAYSPTVNLTGDMYQQSQWTHYRNGRSGSNSNTNTYLKQTGYDYGGNVSWTVFNGGLRENQLSESQANLAIAEFSVASLWLNVISDVRTAYDNYNVNTKQAKLYQKTLDLVKKNRDLVEEEYKAGNAELTRLNESQNELVSAESNYVSSLVNVQNAKAQLDAATNAR